MMGRALFAMLAVVLLHGHALGSDLSEFLPEKVGELIRVQLVVGADAQAEVDKLHGKALEAKTSAIGRYGRPGERPAEVWISRVSSEGEARRQVGLMVHKMYENPKSPFKNPSRVEHGGVSVYRFTGMGQVHLIWFKDDLAWWVSVNPADEGDFLDQFCR